MKRKGKREREKEKEKEKDKDLLGGDLLSGGLLGMGLLGCGLAHLGSEGGLVGLRIACRALLWCLRRKRVVIRWSSLLQSPRA